MVAEAPVVEEKLEKLAVELTALDYQKKTLSGKDKFQTVYTFSFESTTKISSVSNPGVVTPVAAYILSKKALPFRLGQDILVKWKVDEANHLRRAVEFVTLE